LIVVERLKLGGVGRLHGRELGRVDRPAQLLAHQLVEGRHRELLDVPKQLALGLVFRRGARAGLREREAELRDLHVRGVGLFEIGR